ncbi:hypothetical protein [Streptomyces microflavus]|uniref:hypothetical protein n=1 Tax=Streptomyces microflavus TaxID=1919 RepID=UPI0033E25882
MIVVYTPAGGEAQHYDAGTLLVSEASIAARTIDMKWPQIKSGLADEDLDAMRAVAWVLKKRHEATLRFGDFDPVVGEMVTRYNKDEVETWVEGAFILNSADPTITPDQIADALSMVPDSAFDPEHARAFIEKRRAEALEGKDPEAAATAESAPAPKSSAKKTSSASAPSTSDSSVTS